MKIPRYKGYRNWPPLFDENNTAVWRPLKKGGTVINPISGMPDTNNFAHSYANRSTTVLAMPVPTRKGWSV
jgi:hypothetical protein